MGCRVLVGVKRCPGPVPQQLLLELLEWVLGASRLCICACPVTLRCMLLESVSDWVLLSLLLAILASWQNSVWDLARNQLLGLIGVSCRPRA